MSRDKVDRLARTILPPQVTGAREFYMVADAVTLEAKDTADVRRLLEHLQPGRRLMERAAEPLLLVDTTTDVMLLIVRPNLS
ncbi:MAG: hypothetical protein M5R36_00930 [Deltaproteobacteria bacterium]|nr:hypothetical protein [Deltaproteobacteria bacterium]